ncbi:small integral membrane protein 26 isoform X1 [Ochotona curzoniae]|uniref:small integral membrane protein 26 isoform X1 n=1 Tax=Ochotona curzoniae TaxID=130825 RepID=UPI001B3500D5|nr:small integral membrane protein 26 isoform X1 [Ochotona curzoniae]
MQPKQAALWYRRMSVVYAVGAWTVLGSVYLLNRKRKLADDKVEQKEVPAPEASSPTSEILEPPKGFYVETTITFREDFVPITEKILNYWKSWTGGRGPGS